MLPKLSDLIQEENRVVQAFLGRLKDPYGFWYPAARNGTVHPLLAYLLFRGMSKRLGRDELVGLMPMMRDQPVRGSDPLMLLTAFDPVVHSAVEIKDETAYRSRRRSCGPTHPDLRGFGTKHFYGAAESSFDKSSLLHGPMYAGRYCTIRSSAKVIGPVVIGDGALLNTSSVLTRTILGSGSQIDDLVSVKDSVIGSRVYIMSGAKLLHRESTADGSIEVEDRRVRSNTSGKKQTIKRHKLGCVIGDGCTIGANAVLGPATILMPGVKIPHGLYVPSGIYDQGGIANLLRSKR